MKLRRAFCVTAAAVLPGCAGWPGLAETPEPAPVRTEEVVEAAETQETPEVPIDVPMPTTKVPQVTSIEVSPDTRASELISYLASVARGSAASQKKELALATAAFGRTSTPHARVKLGGLYAQPVPGLRDDMRAIALLEPLATLTTASTSDRPIVDLAALLHAQVAERMRLSKDDAKKQDDLRERIEAMKSIERSIMQREERQGSR